MERKYDIEIKNLREETGMNRTEFCEYFNIPYRTVQDWESGRRVMPEYVLRLLEYRIRTDKILKSMKEDDN